MPPGGRHRARRRSVNKALNTLKFMPKKGAELVHKVLWSAVENAQNNQGLDVDDLKVTTHHGRRRAAT